MKRALTIILVAMVCVTSVMPVTASAVGARQILAVGSSHNAIVDESGKLWMCGSSASGQLGNGTTNATNTFTQVMTGVVSVACGTGWTTALKQDGSLWTWGYNSDGRLGNGGKYEYSRTNAVNQVERGTLSPAKVMDNVAMMDAGDCHGAAVRNDGTLWMWGSVSWIGNGVAGNATDVNFPADKIQTVPAKVMDNVTAVSCGMYMTMVLRTDGSVWGWEQVRAPKTPVARKLLDSGGAAVVAGGTHAAVIKTDGSLWMYGENSKGELGIGTTDGANELVKVMDGVKTVSLGYRTTAILKNDGTLYVCGNNKYGQMGIPVSKAGETVTKPVKIMDGVMDIAADNNRGGMATRQDGTVWTWGDNSFGQLGNGGVGDTYYDTGTRTIPYVTTPTKIEFNRGAVADNPSSWATNEVAAAVKSGLISADELQGYRQPISRVRTAQVMVRLIEVSSGQTIDTIIQRSGKNVEQNVFSDTNDEAVAKLYALGIVNGVGGGRFSPEGTLTRAESAAMLNRVARLLNVETGGYSHGFTDVADHWVNSELGWSAHTGIIKGIGEGRFNPNGRLTAEQAIVISYRASEVLRTD